MRNLNNIFKTNNRQAQRRVLDKFDISKEDKNKTLNELSNSNGGGSVSKYAPRYFKIDWDVASKDWEYVLHIDNFDKSVSASNLITSIGATYRTQIEAEVNYWDVVTAYPFTPIQSKFYAFSYIPLFISQVVINAYGIQAKAGFQTFEDIIKAMSSLLSIKYDRQYNLSMDGITEITENEYYKID